MASGPTHRRIALNGVSIFYREAGPAGAPVLLLPHGYPSSSFQFRRLMPALADRWRTIAFDWPGFGYSDTPDPSEFGYKTSVNDMPKAAFTKDTLIRGQRPEGREFSVADAASGLEVSLGLKLPEKYPTDRTLVVAAVDKTTGATVGSVSRKLDDRASTERSGSVSISLPAIKRPGSYRLDAKLTTEVADEKGSKYVTATPLACDTNIAQPRSWR